MTIGYIHAVVLSIYKFGCLDNGIHAKSCGEALQAILIERVWTFVSSFSQYYRYLSRFMHTFRKSKRTLIPEKRTYNNLEFITNVISQVCTNGFILINVLV